MDFVILMKPHPHNLLETVYAPSERSIRTQITECELTNFWVLSIHNFLPIQIYTKCSSLSRKSHLTQAFIKVEYSHSLGRVNASCQ
jgi:hypothetical protein